VLTKSFLQGPLVDGAASWAALHEWALREQAYRKAFPEEVPAEATLAEMVPARDAGDVCGICGEIVSWVDHLPPLAAGAGVRCFSNVRNLQLAPGVRRISGQLLYSSEWL